MKLAGCLYTLLFCIPLCVQADNSMYCPQNQAYIKLGMTIDQVLAACGQPVMREEAAQPAMQKIPVQELIYNNQGGQTAFYGVWNIPTGSGGTSMQINIVNNLVKSVQVNGQNTNVTSICRGNPIQIGDPVTKIYGACGSPDVVNNSYMNQIIQSQQKPLVWIYQPGQYQSAVSLTFVNGKLQSINN